MKLLVAILFIIVSSATAYSLEINTEDPPGEVKQFIRSDIKLFAISSADLNGDSRPDYILVTEQKSVEGEGNSRELVIVLRERDGSLRVVKRNSKIVMCSTCGGGWGDPFTGEIDAATNTFTIQNYGGGGSR